MMDYGGIREATEASPLSRFLRGLNIDLPLLAGLLLLCGAGLVILYSAGGESTALVTRQVIRLGVAFLVMLLAAQFSPNFLRRWSPWAFLGVIFLLVMVLVLGDVGKGAQRWLDFGFMRFQPSELMKLALPMMVAWYLHDRPLPPTFGHLVVLAGIIVLPVMLIIQQPDLGTALLVGSAGAFAVFLAGIRKRWIASILALLAVMAPLAWKFVLHDYQKRRVLTFLNPESDPLNSGYHIIQSKIAIGSGGLFGKGWLNGTQSQLEFLPERHTDFIFAVIGEEFGLLGGIAVLLIYLFIVARGLYIATQAEKTFERILAGSLTLTFFVYVFVNIGMVTGLLPVVGVPLPLISYGGTSMVTLMAGFGILMSIHSHRRFMTR
ncbi:MAG: rod shape-determining protein RodA [Gammaproteobacteria bacterium]|nr:rod shape-determining protein RodA [Gammaproteobacteria bacterium]